MKSNERVKLIPKRNSEVKEKLLRNFLLEDFVYLNRIRAEMPREKKAKTALES